MAWGAFGDETRTCAVIELLNKEIAVHLADERLLRLRVAAYGQMFDPYSALQDVETLATQHPDSRHAVATLPVCGSHRRRTE